MADRREYNRMYKQIRKIQDPEFEKTVSSNNCKLTNLRRKGLIEGRVDIIYPSLLEIERAITAIKILLRDKPDALLEAKATINSYLEIPSLETPNPNPNL